MRQFLRKQEPPPIGGLPTLPYVLECLMFLALSVMQYQKRLQISQVKNIGIVLALTGMGFCLATPYGGLFFVISKPLYYKCDNMFIIGSEYASPPKVLINEDRVAAGLSGLNLYQNADFDTPDSPQCETTAWYTQEHQRLD